MKTKRTSAALQRWGKWALTLLLACALLAGLAITAAARTDWQGEVVDPAIPKPVVTIQGNLVVDKPGGKPTGFYELALCVRSGRSIYGPDPAMGYAAGSEKELTEVQYAQALSDIENSLVPVGITGDSYTVTYYPFRTATAAAYVNTDVLTAVNWAIQNVTYQSYDPATGSYAGEVAAGMPGAYPRGIDTDPKTQGYDELGLTAAEAFPDITTPSIPVQPSVAIDVEGDSRMFAATGQVDHYENDTALLTLSASAPSNKPIILTEDTPLVVARFSYDLKRFGETKVNTDDWKSNVQNSATGKMNEEGLWLGWDKSELTGSMAGLQQKTPLTWLGQSVNNSATGGLTWDFADTDAMLARTRMNQSVWVHMETGSEDLTKRDTYFYYYLGAEEDQRTPDQTQLVNTDAGPENVKHIDVPLTKGAKVLTKGNELNTATAPETPAEYTYFTNLLRLRDRTLVVKLVNDVTFKKPSGVGGNIVEFYDWDDTYLGSLIVGDGDVRDAVNAYVEKNMVHPDLRAGDILANKLGGNVPDYTLPVTPGSDAEEYANLLTSLDREYTYRGKYSCKVDGTGVVRDEAGETAGDPNSVPGAEYKLTNKIDYAFYRHLNTVTTMEYQDAAGKTVTERYVTTQPLTANQDAALYPWAYGWAIVEDNSARNQSSWQARRDGAKTVDTWTTFGTSGELDGLDPSYDTVANPGVQAVPTTLPTGTTPVPGTTLGGGTGIETSYPAFVDPATATAPTDYAYKLDAAAQNDYLRFADFSDMKAQFTKEGQNVLVVKAVYEPGPEILEGYSYRMVKEPYYNKLNAPAAAKGGAYAVVVTLERTSLEHPDGMVRGVDRVRQPAIRQDTTIDQKWIYDEERGIENDLNNPSINTAKSRTETTYTKVDIDNGEELTFTLALSARQNKVDYYTMETYGMNFVSGGTRSDSNYNRAKLEHTIDNYYYFTEDANQNDAFFDQQNFYYQAARYDVREGTHGFVLYGTVNYLMEQATLVNRGVIDNNTFVASATNAAFTDANLRVMSGGVAVLPTNPGHELIIQDALKEAAAWCEANKSPDTWNYERDCAELSPHQLQHFIWGTRYTSRAQADADKFDTCRLHKDCFVDTDAVKLPTNWDELLAAARNTDTEVQDTIGKLTGGNLGTIESISSLRLNSTGGYFLSGGDFQVRFVQAVSAMDSLGIPVSWTTVQYYLMTSTLPADETAADNYIKANCWWYDGAATRTTPTSLKALAAATDGYFDAITLKDGKVHNGGFTAKLAPAAKVFQENAVAGSNEASQSWISMTRNLVKGYENYDNVYDGDGNVVGTDYGDLDGTGSTTKFANYEEFEGYWLDFQRIARQTNLTAEHGMYWELLQYYVLTTEAGGSVDAIELQRLVDLLDNPPASTDANYAEYVTLTTQMNQYWWKDGKKRLVVSSIGTLLKAARQANEGGDTSPLDKVDMALLDSLSLRGSKTGQSFIELGLSRDDVIDKVKAAAALLYVDGDPSSGYQVTDWNDLQYYLIHDSMVSDAYKETVYYWWKNGGTGTEVDISSGGSITARLQLLMQAIVRGSTYGDPKALSKFTDPAKIYSDLALIQTYPGSDFTLGTDGMPAVSVTAEMRKKLEYSSTDDLVTALSGLMDSARAAQTITADYELPALDWWQIQYGLLHGGTYIPLDTTSGSEYVKAYKQYWWYKANDYIIKPPEPDPEPTEALLPIIEKYYKDYAAATTAAKKTAAINALKAKLTNIKALNETYHLLANSSGGKWTAANLTKAKLILVKMADDAKADYYKDWGDGEEKLRLTWAQMQVYFATAVATNAKVTTPGDLLSPADALDRIVNTWGWTKEDSGGANAFIPKEVVLPAKARVSGENGIVDDAPWSEVYTAPDGTEITTTHGPDGTVIVTTKAPDGTMIVTSTAPDGTKTVTTTAPDNTRTVKVYPAPGATLNTEVTPTPGENEGTAVPSGPQSPATPSPEPEEPTAPVDPEPGPEPDEPTDDPDAPAEDVGTAVPGGPQDTETAGEIEETPLGEEAVSVSTAVITSPALRADSHLSGPSGHLPYCRGGKGQMAEVLKASPTVGEAGEAKGTGTWLKSLEPPLKGEAGDAWAVVLRAFLAVGEQRWVGDGAFEIAVKRQPRNRFPGCLSYSSG